MCFCESLKSVGAGGFPGSASFLPRNRRRAKVTRGSGRSRVGARPSSRAHLPGFARQGGGPRGLPRPLPRPCTAQRLLCPEQGSAPGSQPDGFRNRVAAVSALGQPHLCRSALGSPIAPRSESGNPHWRAPSGSPPISCRRTPRCRSRAGETLGSATPPVRPACPAWLRRTGCWGWGSRESAAVEMLGRWQTRVRWVSNRPCPRSGGAQVRPVKEQKRRVLGGEGRWKEGLFGDSPTTVLGCANKVKHSWSRKV